MEELLGDIEKVTGKVYDYLKENIHYNCLTVGKRYGCEVKICLGLEPSIGARIECKF